MKKNLYFFVVFFALIAIFILLKYIFINFNSVNIVLISDNNNPIYIKSTIQSIINSKDKNSRYKIFVLGIRDNIFKKKDFILAKNDKHVKFYFKTIDSKYINKIKKDLNGVNIDFLSKPEFYIILLHDFLPHNVKKVIYIDNQCFVLQDLKALFDLDLSNTYLAAVPYSKLGENEFRYYKQGVMLLNLDKISKSRLNLKFLSYISKSQNNDFSPLGAFKATIPLLASVNLSPYYNFDSRLFDKDIDFQYKVLSKYSNVRNLYKFKKKIVILRFDKDSWYFDDLKNMKF